MKTILISIYIWGIFFITLVPFFLVYCIIWLLSWPFDKKKIVSQYFTAIWAGFYLLINPWWRISAKGKEKLQDQGPFIFTVNHQSILDIPLLYQLYLNFRWVSKAELASVPVLGWVIRMNGHITVSRGEKISVLYMAEKCKEALAMGVSVCFFPEGTRSVNGRLGQFKSGAFILAKETRMPVQPILLYGTASALPKKSRMFTRKQHLYLQVLDEIDKVTVKRLSDEELAEFTHKKMEDGLKALHSLNQ